jgi:3-methyladenine DNA glycosylase AlkD
LTGRAVADFGALDAAFRGAADPARAAAMAAYMRHQFPFLGLPAPEQRRLSAPTIRSLPAPDEFDVVAFTARCWAAAPREFQYAGCDYAIRHVGRCSAAFLPHVRELISTKSWWDTVDALASRVVGPLVARWPELNAAMDEWIDAPDIWLARTALLHQLHDRDGTDADRLFRYCERRASDGEFFLRKAIGWALREYSKTDPVAVRRFVASHATVLSPLSTREALKWLERRGAA